MIFESTEKALSKPQNLSKQHKITNFLQLNFLMKKVHAIPHSDIYHFRVGTGVAFGVSLIAAYYFYRRFKQCEFDAAESINRINFSKPFDAGNQFYTPHKSNKTTHSASQFRRIPEREFDVYFRLRKSYMKGHFDHTKEILIPKDKNGNKGYDIITPFYYYNLLSPDPFFTMNVNGKPEAQLKPERAGIAVHRGWIPSSLKDRRMRPYDLNSPDEKIIFGVLKMDRKPGNHKFYTPNNPTYEVWNNFSLEDFSWFWDLPNINVSKYVYFQEVYFHKLIPNQQDAYPNKTEVVEAVLQENKERGIHLDRNYKLYYKSLSLLSTTLFYMLYVSF